MLELMGSGEFWGNKYRDERPLWGPSRDVFKRLLDFKPGCGILKLKYLTMRAPLDYHQLNTYYLQQCCNTLHNFTHLHGILNITVHQPPGYKIEMSLTYNKNTHTHSDKTSTRIIATISKNKHNMYYSHVKSSR